MRLARRRGPNGSSGSSGFDWTAYPKAKPKRVAGGIKANTQRGAFGTKWWAKRWIAALEQLNLGGRLVRGRSYARAGQVLDIAIAPGSVSAKVQGSRPTPYSVSIRTTTLDAAAWRRIIETIASEARFTATLAIGDMPQDIEEAFARAGASLFPASARDLTTTCSCPDVSNPCKHIAAVYYLLGEEFDRDPFLLFTLRGGSKSDVLGNVVEAFASSPPPLGGEPLPLEHREFWHGTGPDDGGAIRTDVFAQQLTPRAIVPFPFWRGSEPLGDVLTRIDEAARAVALQLLADGLESVE
jgi:hypothetical protein